MSNNSEGLKIMSATAENFKSFSQKTVKLDGRSIAVFGKNGVGKSSLIDLLIAAFNSNFMPLEPIKQGEDRGKFSVEIAGTVGGEPESYTIEYTFSPQFQKGKLKLYNKNGEEVKKSPGEILKFISGSVGFDPFAFIKMGLTPTGDVSKPGVAQQCELLTGIMPVPAQQAIATFDKEYDEEYKRRTANNQRISTLESELLGSDYTQAQIDLYEKHKDSAELNKKFLDLTKKNESYNSIRRGIVERQSTSLELLSEIEELQKKIEEKTKKKTQVDLEIVKAEEWLSKNKDLTPEIEALSKEISDISTHNSNHEKVKSYQLKHKELRDLKVTVERQGKQLEKLKASKRAVYESDVLPVPNLMIEDGQILYKGLPFSEKNIPKSTIIAIGVRIAMALNPTLKVIVIKDASLLDNETAKIVMQMADKYNYQVIMEFVDDSKSDVQVEWIEDYLKIK